MRWRNAIPFEIRPISEGLGLSNARATFLEQYIPKNGIGAEIGVYKGHFSRVLLGVTAPKKLHLIDPWYLHKLEWTWARGNKSTISALRSILRRFEKELADGTVVLNIAFDLDFLPTLPDRYFDWVYLDSTHKYKQTVSELDVLMHKVKREGVIAGDDWCEDSRDRHHGVCKAVREFVAREPYELIYSSSKDKQWAIRERLGPAL